MKRAKPGSNRGVTIAALLAAIGVCTALLPWGRWFSVSFDEVAEARLRSRAERYQELRRLGDWRALYEMTAPTHRRRCTLENFLGLYGANLIEVERLQTKSIDIDRLARTADVEMDMVGRLVPDRLPADKRRGFQVNDPALLRKAEALTIGWVWDDDDWFFLMDPVAVGGRAPGGREAVALQPGKKK